MRTVLLVSLILAAITGCAVRVGAPYGHGYGYYERDHYAGRASYWQRQHRHRQCDDRY